MLNVPFNFAFIRKNANTNLIATGLNYKKFIDLSINSNLQFRYIYNESIVNEEFKIHKQFAYAFYHFLRNGNLIVGLYWTSRYYKTKTPRQNKYGTIKNFVYMNNELGQMQFNESEFSRLIKFIYIINKNDMLPSLLKRLHFYKNDNISENMLNDMVNKYKELPEFVFELLKLIKKIN